MIEQCEMSTKIGEARLDLWRTYRTPRAVHFYGSQPRDLRSRQKMDQKFQQQTDDAYSDPFIAIHSTLAKYFTHVCSRYKQMCKVRCFIPKIDISNCHSLST